MNLKEISELTGKSKRTVELWISNCEKISQSISEKISQAKAHRVSANFTLPETIEIIKAGGNETLANLLFENANKPVNNHDSRIDRLETMMMKLCETVNNMAVQFTYVMTNNSIQNNRVLQIEHKKDGFDDWALKLAEKARMKADKKREMESKTPKLFK